MFNGIIKYTGKVFKIYKKRKHCTIIVKSKMKFRSTEIGSSVCCSGACLTLEKHKKNLSYFFLSKETINRTIFKYVKINELLNLEKPMKYGDRISGHFVQGHVDTTAKIQNIIFVGKAWKINFNLNKKYKKFIVEKGSIAINGVSLTISKIYKKGFQVVVIPQSLKLTNLTNLRNKDLVNVEFDVLTKYVKSFIK